jgi:RHS repeat-associated protein
MLVPNRHGSSTAYRYGFQGQEKDDELKGEGNSLDFGNRMYDPRTGRFFSRDPLERKYSMFSPYSAFANNPMFYVDKDGNENIIYVVNVPDGSGKKTMSDKELQRRITKANSILKSKAEKGGYELNTRYVLYNPHPSSIPYTKKESEINRRYLDKTDGVILIGHAEDVKRYDRKNNVTNMSDSDKAAGTRGWVPYRVLNGLTQVNPENTVSSMPGSDKRGGYIDTSTTDFDEQVFLMLHSGGHMSKTPNEGVEHRDYDDKGLPDPNIMMSGDARSEWYRGNANRRTPALWSSSLEANETFKSKMLRNFGDKPASDNYEKNKQNSSKQVGPLRPDGTF